MMIESARLFVRPFRAGDEHVCTWLRDPAVMQHIPGGADTSVEQTATRLGRYQSHFEEHGFSKYLLVDRSTGEAIGDGGIMHLDGTPYLELGYRIRRDRWGRGLATEAARAILTHAFLQKGIATVHAIVEPENVASVHVVTCKLGFLYERTDTFLGVTMGLYRMDAHQWRGTP